MGSNARARRARRKASVVRGRPRDNGLRVERIDVSDAPVGPDIVVPPLEDVLQAIAGAPAADDWQAIRKVVVPIFPRARPFPAGYPAPLTALVPPGVLVAFAAHVGPALLMITKQQLEVLGITQTELVAEGLANLIGHAAQVPRTAIVRQSVGGLPVAALQTGQSIGSALVLIPDQLWRLFGPTPALFLAPLRDGPPRTARQRRPRCRRLAVRRIRQPGSELPAADRLPIRRRARIDGVPRRRRAARTEQARVARAGSGTWRAASGRLIEGRGSAGPPWSGPVESFGWRGPIAD